jgi:hypothetical protein
MSFKIGAFGWKINCKSLKERPAGLIEKMAEDRPARK